MSLGQKAQCRMEKGYMHNSPAKWGGGPKNQILPPRGGGGRFKLAVGYKSHIETTGTYK
jgi:hypothetical protein